MQNIDSVNPPKTVLARVVGASVVGSSLEWYDFFLYATASALVFGPVFFPSEDPLLGTLLALGTFGVGFFARPVGALIFGHIGDRLGRKPSLVATLLLMGITTTIIGLVPGFDVIGMWAPVLLVVLRLLQGLGAGAEHAGATVFSTEYAPERSRGLFGSFPAAGLYIGVLLSSGVFSLFALLPETQFMSWGWRIPFLLSIVLVAVGLFIRLRIDETPEFTELEQQDEVTRSPIISTFRDQWRSVLIVLGIVAGPFTATYVYQTYSLSYMKDYLDIPGSYGTLSLTIASIVATLSIPFIGALSDRIGRRPVIIVGAVVSAGFAFPFFWLLASGQQGWIGLAMACGIGLGVPLMLGPQGALLTELFSAQNRFSGFAISRELGSLLFAGLTPLISAVLVSSADGASWPVSTYVIGACALTLITSLLIRETAPVRR